MKNFLGYFKTLWQLKNWGSIKTWWNKDLRGALTAIAAIIVAFFLLLTVVGCTVSPAHQPRLEFGAHIEMDQDKPVLGHDPVGMARIIYPVYTYGPWGATVNAEYLHLSSIPDNDDLNTVDQVGVTFSVPLGRRAPDLRMSQVEYLKQQVKDLQEELRLQGHACTASPNLSQE